MIYNICLTYLNDSNQIVEYRKQVAEDGLMTVIEAMDKAEADAAELLW